VKIFQLEKLINFVVRISEYLAGKMIYIVRLLERVKFLFLLLFLRKC